MSQARKPDADAIIKHLETLKAHSPGSAKLEDGGPVICFTSPMSETRPAS